MVVIIYPEWYEKVRKSINATIIKMAMENDIPLRYVADSKTIEDAKDMIMNVLVRIDREVNVEERKRLKKFEENMKSTTNRASKKVKGGRRK